MINSTVEFQDLGLIDYKECWDYQTELFENTVQQKIFNRKNPENKITTKNHLIFCEHPHVYTLGKSGDEKNLLINDSFLKKKNASYYEINRGGDITYHGPGQLVVYPIFDLDHFFTDIHKYLRFLEESVILTLKEYGINSGRVKGLTGVWLDGGKPSARKICALGVKSSRWVTMHGIGFNVNTNLDYFNYIVPCGIEDKQVTSMSKELKTTLNFQEIKNKLKINMANVFDFDFN
ncbi:MAG: lipoyl(octanoyl) transferase [Crocinitomicaceae bacterium]|nr:lipoyl(octanoyl) transferase [Crocinitomicaceae bacterium]|tara:strand:+ start:15718 stop:16419 length:702 start_codon:yes stop_codon:yes gene_type:complete